MKIVLLLLFIAGWLWLCFEFIGWVASTFGLAAAIVVGVLMFAPRARK